MDKPALDLSRPRSLFRRPSSRSAFTLVELLVVIAIIGILVALLLPAVQAAREAARRVHCANNIKQLSIAILNYNTSCCQFPSGGAISSSPGDLTMGWHAFILPYIEQQGLYDQANPGSVRGGQSNLDPSKHWLPVLNCPTATKPIDDFQNTGESKGTNYVGITGAGVMRRQDLENSHCGDYYADGLLYPDSATRSAHIRDGTSNSMLIGERVYETRTWLGGNWWAYSPTQKLCSYSAKNLRWPLGSRPQEVGYYVHDSDAPEGSPKNLLFNDFMFASEHKGGALFSFADGSVHFLPESIDFTTAQRLAMIADGEPTGWEP